MKKKEGKKKEKKSKCKRKEGVHEWTLKS